MLIGMEPDARLLAQLLSIIALLAATIEYCEILQRRTAQRLRAAMRSQSEEAGLRGLVRVFLADEAA